MRSAAASLRTSQHSSGAATDARTATFDGGYWRRADWIAILLIGVVAVRIHELFPVLHIIKPVLSLSIIGTILLLRNSTPNVRARLFAGPVTRMVLVYLGVVGLTVPFALWPQRAFEIFQGMGTTVLMVVAIQFCVPRRETLDRLQLGFVTLAFLYGFYLQVTGARYGGRLTPSSGTYDANDIAAVLAVGFPLALGLLARTRDNRRRTMALLGIGGMVLGVVATGSRGGTLALLVGALVYLAGLRAAKAIIVGYFGILAAGVVWFTAPPTFRARILSLTNLENDYNMTSEVGRKAVWQRGRIYIREHPVLGVGAGNFEMAEGAYHDETGMTGKWSAAHNAYVQAFAELGFVGGSVFVLMLLVGAGSAYRYWRKSAPPRGPPPLRRPEYLAALTAYASAAYFLSHAYFAPLFAVLGLIALAGRTVASERCGELVDTGMEPGTAGPAPSNRGERGGLSIEVVRSRTSPVRARTPSRSVRGGLLVPPRAAGR